MTHSAPLQLHEISVLHKTRGTAGFQLDCTQGLTQVLFACLSLSPLRCGLLPSADRQWVSRPFVNLLNCLLMGLNQALMRQRPHCRQGPLCALNRPDLQLSQNALEPANNHTATSVDLCRTLEPGGENLNQVDNYRTPLRSSMMYLWDRFLNGV